MEGMEEGARGHLAGQGVKALMEKTGVREHITFGGRLLPDAKGFPASAMAKKLAGDWRDAAQVKQWPLTIAAQLRGKVSEQIFGIIGPNGAGNTTTGGSKDRAAARAWIAVSATV
jgi:hypothetical protein